MAYVAATPLPPQVLDASGNPLANGTLEFYLTGTSTATPVYSDDSGTSLGATVTLNSRGEPQTSGGTATQIYYDTTKVYKIVRKDSAGTPIAPTIDPFIPSASFAPITPVTYGAAGDKTTDCLAAFDSALAAAYTGGRALYIPGLAPGYFYKMSDAWAIQDRDDIHIYGDGTASLLCIANASAADCVYFDSTTHASLSRIGICGISGSGHGIEIDNSSHHNTFSDIWIGFVDGDGFKNTHGISTRVHNLSIDQNNSYRPFSYTGTGLTEGVINNGLYVPYQASDQNNDFNAYGLQLNGVGGSGYHGLKVGDSSGDVDGFYMAGGLIQGPSSYQCVYMKTRDSILDGVWIEPPVGATSAYVVEFDTCVNTVIKARSLAGDVKFTGACVDTGIEGARCGGIDISATSVRPFARRGTYANVTNGPTSGAIIDRSAQLITEEFSNASDSRFDATLNFSYETALVFKDNFEIWNNDASPSKPAHLNTVGSPTITRDGTTKYSGSYSCKVVTGVTVYADGLTFNPPQPSQMAGRNILISCRVYVETSGKKAYIYANWNSGAVVKAVGTQQTGTWERLTATLRNDSGDSSLVIRIAADASTTFYVDEVQVWADGYYPVEFKDISDAAVPDVSAHGNDSCYAPPFVILNGTTTVTDVDGLVPGKPVTAAFTGSKTIDHDNVGGGSGPIISTTGSDDAMSAGDQGIFLLNPDDGLIYFTPK